jgi:Protein of unknown function (DUF3551)
MIRILLVAALVPAAGCLNARPASAQEGPWCALRNFSDLSEDCQFRTLEECRVTIIAGNRGFCNPNPRWQGEVVKRRPYHRG